MPVRVFKTYETHIRVIDPIVEQLTYSVLQSLGMAHYFAAENQQAIFFHGDRYAISGNHDHMNRPRVSTDRCDVTVEEIMNPVSTKWDMVKTANLQAHWNSFQNKNTDVPLFSDPRADVQVVEVMVPAGLNLEFKLSFNTIDGAMAAVDALINQHHQQAIPIPHDIAYSYPLDMEISAFLMMVYELRRFEQTPKPTWLEYITANSTEQIGIDIHREDTGKPAEQQRRQLVIRKRQISTIGMLEYTESKPQPEKNELYTDRFVVTFQYMFQFARPSNFRATFPVMIDNRPVDPIYCGTNENTTIRALDGRYQERSFNRFFQNTVLYTPPITVVRFPEYDTFEVPKSPVRTAKFNHFFIAGMLLQEEPPAGETERKMIIDLKNLGGYTLHEKVQELMKLHAPTREIFGVDGLYNITVFSNQFLVPVDKLSITDDLVLTVDVQDLSKRYHLVISEATDVFRIGTKWLQVLVDNRCFFPSTVAANLQFLIKKGIYQIVPSHPLLTLLRRCLRSGSIDPLLQQLIDDGRCNRSLWDYTLTAEQLAAYLSITKSLNSDCYLYEELVKLGLAEGCITQDTIPPRYITHTVDAFAVRQGGLNVNVPLRILNTDIAAS